MAHRLHVAELQARLAARAEALDGAAASLDQLTSREREVLHRIAAGATVHKHAERTCRKLDVGNRTGAARVLHDSGTAQR